MKIVLKRLNDNYQHYFTDVSTMHAKRIKKLQLLTLRIEHQFFSYITICNNNIKSNNDGIRSIIN